MNKFHSTSIGNGRPLIFMPAFGFTGIEGLNIAEALSEKYECHLLDLPGLGKSEGIKGEITINKIADWLKEYLDQHDMRKVTLIGHSLGGALALCFTSVYPEYVTKLVLLDQGHIRIPRFPTKDYGPLGYVMPLLSTLERVFGDKFVTKIYKIFTSKEENEHVEATKKLEEEIKEFCARFQVEDSEYIRKAFKEGIDFTPEGLRLLFGYYRLNLPNILKDISVPSLLIYASFKDIDEKRAVRTEKAVKKIQYVEKLSIIGLDCHHYVHWAGDTTLLEVQDFLTVR